MPVSPPAAIVFRADFRSKLSSHVLRKKKKTKKKKNALITAGSHGVEVSSTFTSHSQSTQQGEPACLAAPVCVCVCVCFIANTPPLLDILCV